MAQLKEGSVIQKSTGNEVIATVNDLPTAYVHPTTHSPSIIAQDANNRFVTDTEKQAWNGKADTEDLHEHTNKSWLDTITETLINNWNSAVTHISDAVKHITSAERTLWNTVSDKADAVHNHTISNITDMPAIPDKTSDLTNDSGYITSPDGGDASTVNGFTIGVNVPANAKFTDTVYSHPANHPPSIISQDTNNRFVTDAEKTAWNGKAAGSHTHATLTAGNGLTGTAYSAGTAQTWSITSHAGTAGSIGTINVGSTTLGVNLGMTSTTAFRGDYGNTAYTHSQAAHAPSNAQANQTLTSGNGMAAWTATSGNLTIAMGTPGTLTGVTTNALTATSHTHEITLTAADVGADVTTISTVKPVNGATMWYEEIV